MMDITLYRHYLCRQFHKWFRKGELILGWGGAVSGGIIYGASKAPPGTGLISMFR